MTSDERVDHAGLEVPAGAVAQLRDRRVDRHRLPVDAVRRHRVEGVACQDDPRAERDVVPGQPHRVAGAVPVLVAGDHDRAGAGQGGHRLHDPCAQLRVATHDLPLVVGERAGLVEDRGGNRDLADVVQSRGDTDVAQRHVGQLVPAPDLLGHPDQRLGVVARVLVLRLECVRKRAHRRQERLLELIDQRAVVDGEQRLVGDPGSIRSSRELGGPRRRPRWTMSAARFPARSPIGTSV